MKSKASFRGHPIHPALIPFPFAFLVGSFVFDAIGWLTGNLSLSRTAAYLAIGGLGTAVLAAIPGVIDYWYTVPPESSGQRRARRHALANVAALLLFFVASWMRSFSDPPTVVTLGLTLVGTGALTYAGWQGGILVSRNLISVDHRHAQAGKWRETSVAPERGPVIVAAKGELKEGQMKLVRYGDRRIVLGRANGEYVAFDDRCTHRGASLADGVLISNKVQCLWHGSRFDCGSGKAVCGPAKAAVRTYPVSEGPNGIAITVQKER